MAGGYSGVNVTGTNRLSTMKQNGRRGTKSLHFGERRKLIEKLPSLLVLMDKMFKCVDLDLIHRNYVDEKTHRIEFVHSVSCTKRHECERQNWRIGRKKKCCTGRDDKKKKKKRFFSRDNLNTTMDRCSTTVAQSRQRNPPRPMHTVLRFP